MLALAPKVAQRIDEVVMLGGSLDHLESITNIVRFVG
jgi:inosine-uridine nucleoside N-ribohydrolase